MYLGMSFRVVIGMGRKTVGGSLIARTRRAFAIHPGYVLTEELAVGCLCITNGLGLDICFKLYLDYLAMRDAHI